VILVILGLVFGAMTFFAPEIVELIQFNFSVMGYDLSVTVLRLVLGGLSFGLIVKTVMGFGKSKGIGGLFG